MSSLPGLCAGVCKGEEGDCIRGDLGTFRPSTEYHIHALKDCRAECKKCARCRFIRGRQCARNARGLPRALRTRCGQRTARTRLIALATPFGKRRATPLSTTRLPLRPFCRNRALIGACRGRFNARRREAHARRRPIRRSVRCSQRGSARSRRERLVLSGSAKQ